MRNTWCSICGHATKNGYYPVPDGKGKFQHEECLEEKEAYLSKDT